uniref:Serine/threonine-protein kinase n=1 Tax=Ascaris suum TaxID=6253 RepID=F1L882_ASCSU
MGSPIGQIKLSVGDKVRDTFVVRKKLGEGSCGTVFLVESVKDKQKAAMKVEPFMKSKDDEILKMEVYVLKKLQKSKHACRLLLAGKMNNFSFLVMSLLGKELSDIRRRLPERRMSVASTLRIGVQSVEAIHDVHKIGFVHRDVKPTNFAMGHKDRDMLFIFDFGLARQIFFPDKRNRMKLREPRKKVSFRGTVRYCSVNVHQYKEPRAT